MVDGQNTGGHTIDSAQQAIRGLLSLEREDTQSRESQPEPETEEVEEQPETAEDEQPEQHVDGEEPEETEETDEELDQPRVRRLKIDGKDVDVTEEELEKGYLRQSDYTRKTQELSTKRKSFDEQELPAVRAERQRLAAQLQQLEDAVKSYTPEEPDWETLRLQDPDTFSAKWADWQLHQKRLTAIAEAKQKAFDKVAADQTEQFKTYLQGEQAKLLEKVPSWSDAKVARSEKAKLLSYAQENGFSEDELKQVADHRALVMLRKAMLYDEAQKAKPAVRQKIDAVVRTATPGSANQPSRQVSDLTKQKQRLAKTGSVDDAAAVIKTMIGQSRKAAAKRR
jgi:hypothetical protein